MNRFSGYERRWAWVFAVLSMTVALPAAEVGDGSGAAPKSSSADLHFFETKVRPILVDKCYKCHSHEAGKSRGGLMLDSRAGILQGGNTGPAVEPGKPEESLLIQAVRYSDEDLQMPPKGEKLGEQDVADLTEWVRRGAGAPAPVVAKEGSTAPVPSGRNHWAFKPVRKPAAPAVQNSAWVKNPIDNFILAKLEANGLTPSAPADKAVLLRRVYLDLTGLPPRYEEVEAFLKDRSAGAFARVVDRLLGSPQYGEHWARYWLDIARYSDTKGKPPTSFDPRQPHAWTYRDWVIDAFNTDLSYDQFIRAQLAGDYLQADAEKLALAQRQPAPGNRAHLAALGFLTLGDQFGGRRVDIVDDQINVTGTAFLGLTVACARCHDHKTDPIPTKDYYSLYGVFANSVQPELLPTMQATVPPSPEYDDYLQKLRELEKRKAGYKVMHDQYLRFKAARNEGKGEGSELSNEEIYKMYLKAHRHRLWANLDAADLEMFHPGAPPRANSLVDVPDPSDYPLLLRGVFYKRGEKVPRRMPGILTPDPKNRTEWREGSGRRQLAEEIADARNPLTARVFVNRIWQQHWGAGLVETPDDFGHTGAQPTHPELLDWLAASFVEQRWSIKSLHRIIVLSAAYQQSSGPLEGNLAVDPGNKLRWRHPLRRLSFEMMHDSLLAVTGQLDLTRGGKPVPIHSAEFSRRRAIYTLIDRSNFPELFAQYDLPSRSAGEDWAECIPGGPLLPRSVIAALDHKVPVTTRRGFLLNAAAAIASAATCSLRGAVSPAPSIPIIDSHVHFYDPTRPQGVPFPSPKLTALYKPFLPAHLERVAARFNVAGTIVIEASPWVEDNQWILDLAAEHPSIVGCVGSLRLGGPDFAGNLRRFAANPLFRGLRLSAEDLKQGGQPGFDSGLRLLAERELAVDVLGKSNIVAPVLRLARRWPKLRIVIDHMPFAEHEGDPMLIRRSLGPIADRPNVFLKVSHIARKMGGSVVEEPGRYRPAFDALFGLVGPNRLLFGSDWPVSNLIAPYAMGLGIASEYFATKARAVAEGFFWRNSYAAYRWMPRGRAAALAP